MTEETQPHDTEQEQPPAVTPNARPTVVTGFQDLMLSSLTATAQTSSSDIGLSVTLSVHGTLITGTLRGRNYWFKQLREWLATRDMGPLGDMWIEDYTYDPEDTARLDDDHFLHLADARYLVGGGFAPDHGSEGAFVRIKLGEVDAWSVGNFDPPASQG